MKRIAIVADELYPFTAGGIGRLNHNLIVDGLARDPELEFHLLFPSTVGVDVAKLRTYFGERVFAHIVPIRHDWICSHFLGASYPPALAFTDTPEHSVSLDVALKLMELETNGLRFDWIEFADYLGRGYCTLQERRLGRFFSETRIAIRLHSTHSILQRFEPPNLLRENVSLAELERKALRDADRIIAHLPAIAEANKEFYGFPDAWLSRVEVNFPPVVVDLEEGQDAGLANPDLVFGSKLQQVKRPDLFIRGAVLFMLENPQYTGDALLACHVVERDAWKRLSRVIPKALLPRFKFVQSQEKRLTALRNGIVVIPSDFESLNLLAYEAAHLGARLVLNRRCPAFGDNSPFISDVNCRAFDGTVDDLARAMKAAWQAPSPETVRWKVTAPYWSDVATPRGHGSSRATTPLVSVIITNYNLSKHLPEALESVAASTYPNIEIVLVDDSSTAPFDNEAISALESSEDAAMGRIRVVRNRVNRGLPASRNIAIRNSIGDYVLPLDADDRISPDFVQLAVNALERHRDFDVVAPSVGYFDTDDNLFQKQFIDYAVFIGDAPSQGLLSNRFSTATSLMRRSLFAEGFSYNETLTSYEDWDLYLRLALAGKRFLVTNDIHFYYRRRPGSMIHGVDHETHLGLLAKIYDALPSPLPPGVRMRTHLTGTVAAGSENGTRPPLRHVLADSMNHAIKRAPRLHQTLKTGTSSLIRLREALKRK